MKKLVDKMLEINVWLLFSLLIVAAEALSILLALVINALFYDGTNNLIMLGAFVIPIIVAPIIIILLIIMIRELRDSRLQLDRRVKDRTVKLTSAVGDLEKEINERKKAEEELYITKKEIEALNLGLEKRVEEKSREIKESQKQLIQAEKLSALGQLTAGLAHELTSPLTGLLPLLRKYHKSAQEGSEESSEMKLMLEGCEYMAKIVRDFASFSKTSSGNLEEVDLNETIKLTLGLILKNLQLKSIQVNEEYTDSLPKVKGIKTEFQQVILNILMNAQNSVSEGGKINIKTEISEDANNVVMEFKDTGEGIEKEDLGKIFDPFFSTKKYGKGVGLGLSISYGIINKCGGKITVDSEPGKGSVFSVHLPVIV